MHGARFLAVLIALMVVLAVGCADVKPATGPISSVLFSVTFTGDSDPDREPAGLIVDVDADTDAKRGSGTRSFAFTPNSHMPGRFTTFLVRLDLPAGRYRIARLSATTAFEMPIPQYDIAPAMVFDVRPKATDYLGHVELSEARQTSDLRGASARTAQAPQMAILDGFEDELPGFVHAWPTLRPRQIGRRAPQAVTAIAVQMLGRPVAKTPEPLPEGPSPAATLAPRGRTAATQRHAAKPAASPGTLPGTLPAASASQQPADAKDAIKRKDTPTEARALITILEGHAWFIRGAVRFRAAPGVRLDSGDVIATDAGTLLQLEYADGVRVEIGPKTQLLLLESAPSPQPSHAAFLLEGWTKVTAEASAGTAAIIRTARIELTAAASVCVSQASGDETRIFAETGSVHVVERNKADASGRWDLRQGQFFEQTLRQTSGVSPRPPAQFIAGLPPAYRDSLPARAAAFRGIAKLAERGPDFTVADVEPWLKLNDPILNKLAERWKRKTSDPALKRALEANIKTQWDSSARSE